MIRLWTCEPLILVGADRGMESELVEAAENTASVDGDMSVRFMFA